MNNYHALSFLFFLYGFVSHRVLHSFPTRRSSDLKCCRTTSSLRVTPRPGRSGTSIQPCSTMGLLSPSWIDVPDRPGLGDRKSTRLNSSHLGISYAVFCLKKKKKVNLYIYIA